MLNPKIEAIIVAYLMGFFIGAIDFPLIGIPMKYAFFQGLFGVALLWIIPDGRKLMCAGRKK